MYFILLHVTDGH